MKIRRYKGPALDKLYDTIRQELGPEAVVVTAAAPKTSGLLGLIGGATYELIAVADDRAADRHLLTAAGGDAELRRLTALQARRLEQLETSLRDLRGDLAQAVRRGADGAGGVPEFAGNWDPEFLRAARAQEPRLFDEGRIAECRAVVRGLLRVEPEFPVAAGRRPHIVVLAGPTGSGKTTTLAKLAARWSLDRKLKVGLITTDTFRIAAVDQIREYATLLGLDLRVAFSAGEAARAAQSLADRDVILVDTPGRNHYDQAGLLGLRGVLQGMGAVTVLMLVPATADRRNVAEIMESFEVLNFNYLVITKVDETRHYELLTAAAAHSACPVAFITNGQRVPQDIRPAALDELVEMLVPEEPI